jgi:hypothetical protein
MIRSAGTSRLLQVQAAMLQLHSCVLHHVLKFVKLFAFDAHCKA